ncbi:MAG: pentapeptide repeat-containing protein [Ketobacter sp.]|nr:pentapeptide repeat-containing protein [Ketobacter sp.]
MNKVTKAIKATLWVCKDLSGYLHLKNKVRLPNEEGKSPSTIVLWVVAVYVAIYGLATNRYENRLDRIENQINAFYAQLGGPTFRSALTRIPSLQNFKLPIKPEIHNPVSVMQSFFIDRVDMESREELSLFVESLFRDGAETEANTILVNLPLDGIDLSKRYLPGLSIKGLGLKEANFDQSRMVGRFDYSDLEGAKFSNLSSSGLIFAHSNLNSVSFENSEFRLFEFYFDDDTDKCWNFKSLSSDIASAVCHNDPTSNLNFSGLKAFGSKFENVHISNSNFENISSLNGINPIDSDNPAYDTNFDFINVKLKEVSFQDSNLRSSNFINFHHYGVTFERSDLSNSTFKNGDLSFTNFRRSNLRNAKLINVEFGTITSARDSKGNHFENISNNTFLGANMEGMVFKNSNIGASFNNVSLVGSAFICSRIISSTFKNSDLRNVDFSNTTIEGTNFIGAKNLNVAAFSSTIGLISSLLPHNILDELQRQRPDLFIETDRDKVYAMAQEKCGA